MAPKRFSIEVQARLPARLADLDVLANNLLYAWDRRVRRVFRHMDPILWDRCGHNPKVFLRQISSAVWRSCSMTSISWRSTNTP